MPESIESYAARVAAAAGPDDRLPLPDDGMVTWDNFPFEASDLRLKPLAPLADVDPPRMGEDPADCYLGACAATPRSTDWTVVWTDDHWQVKAGPPSGLPVLLMLEPLAHTDLADLPAERAVELGPLIVALTSAVEALPTTSTCHVARYGDGAAHVHWWFTARPPRMLQFRGTFNEVWDDLVPPIPADVRDENVAFVVDRLVTASGGQRVG